MTSQRAGIDRFAYFRDLLLRIHTHPAERITDLIPCGPRDLHQPVHHPLENVVEVWYMGLWRDRRGFRC